MSFASDFFTWHNTCQVHPYCSLFTTKYYSAVWIGHIWLIHSSVDGHVGRFHLEAITNNAAVDIPAHVFM